LRIIIEIGHLGETRYEIVVPPMSISSVKVSKYQFLVHNQRVSFHTRFITSS